MACFDAGEDYPSNDSNHEIMYDLLNITLCHELELTAEYNFDLDKEFENIKRYSLNHFYKD